MIVKKNIKLEDWERILFGKAPVEFLVEVLIRAGIIYFVLLIVVKLMGKRMSGRLTITEWAVMLTLGSLISLPMQAPERGLLNGIVLLAVVFIFHRVQAWWTFHHKKAEAFVLGEMVMIVREGVMNIKEMRRQRLSKEQLFAVLRGQKVYNLGMVKRLYQEATGDFSLYRAQGPGTGLSLVPPGDEARKQQKFSDRIMACTSCGHTEPSASGTSRCTVCGNHDWEQAAEQKEENG